MTERFTQEEISILKIVQEVTKRSCKYNTNFVASQTNKKSPTKPKSTVSIEIPDFIVDKLTSAKGYEDGFLVSEVRVILATYEADKLPRLEGTNIPDISRAIKLKESGNNSMVFENHFFDYETDTFVFDLSEMIPLLDMNDVLREEVVPIQQRLDAALMEYDIERYHSEIRLTDYQID